MTPPSRLVLFENGAALGVFSNDEDGNTPDGNSAVVMEPSGACFTQVRQVREGHRGWLDGLCWVGCSGKRNLVRDYAVRAELLLLPTTVVTSAEFEYSVVLLLYSIGMAVPVALVCKDPSVSSCTTILVHIAAVLHQWCWQKVSPGRLLGRRGIPSFRLGSRAIC